jgi:hypothetical protein
LEIINSGPFIIGRMFPEGGRSVLALHKPARSGRARAEILSAEGGWHGIVTGFLETGRIGVCGGQKQTGRHDGGVRESDPFIQFEYSPYSV